MTREEFVKQRCEIDKITEAEFEKTYRVVDCNCGAPYCKGYRCLDLDDLLKENQELKKQLEERKYYKFYKYENNPYGSDHCFCERPCNSNMSLKCFFENGEICGFMSESLVDYHPKIEEISLNEFAHDFIKPLINANFQNKNQQKEFIKYLEDEMSKWHYNYDSYNYEYEVEEPTAEKLVDEILQKYKKNIRKEII